MLFIYMYICSISSILNIPIVYRETFPFPAGEGVYRAGHSHHGRFQWEPEVLYTLAH